MFEGFSELPEPEHIALLGFGSNTNVRSIGLGRVQTVKELLAEIRRSDVMQSYATKAVPEQYVSYGRCNSPRLAGALAAFIDWSAGSARSPLTPRAADARHSFTKTKDETPRYQQRPRPEAIGSTEIGAGNGGVHAVVREMSEYQQIVERFASEGAALIGEDIRKRYGGKAYESARPLEPGFIPLDRRPRITFVTWYPNASDLKRDSNYHQLRRNFEHWRDRGDIESYRAAYEDWVASLPVIDFYRNNMLPELMAVGVSPREIAWLPMVKAPHPARSDPDPFVVNKDKDTLWLQLKLLQPAVVVVHGAKVWAALGERIRDVYERVLPQKILYVASAKNIEKVVAEVTPRLRRYLDETT